MIRRIFNIIPRSHSGKLGLNIALSTINQLLDFISVILLLPILLGIFNPGILTGMVLNFPFIHYIVRFPVESLIAVVSFYVIKNILSVMIIRFQSEYYYSISNALSIRLMRNFLDKELLEVKSEKNSIVMKDIIFVPNNFVNFVFGAVNQLISDAFLMLLILFGCFYINPVATVFLFLITTILITGMYHYEKRKLDIINKAVEGKYNSNFSHLSNSLNGFVEIKVNRLEEYFIGKFNSSNTALNEIYSELTTNRLAKPKYTESFLILIIAFLFLSSKYLVRDEGANVVLVAFLFAASIKVVPAVNRMLISIANLKSNLYTIDILLKDASNEALKQPSALKKPFLEKIELRNVSFGFYESKPLLKNIDLTIRKGEIIGIFGDSGNGKSTLINILTTLIRPENGNLFCDDEPITDSGPGAYLDNIAYVPQSPFLMEGTIHENLLLDGQLSAESDLGRYFETFELKEVIEQLPKKLDTFIGSSGYTLSGGQLQRLAIVRALMRKPQILLLDEATNQMDEQLRERISVSIKEIAAKENMTIVVVSHNQGELLSFSDRVYELKNAGLYPISQ